MNATLTYQEPYRFSAGMLALTVHLLFFFFLYFGFRWQSQPQEVFMVEMWDSLPNAEVVPEQEPIPAVMLEPAPPPPKIVAPVLPPVEAEIEVRDKKKRKKEKQAQKDKEKAVAAAREKQEKEKKEKEAAAAAKANREKEQRELDEYVARRKQADQARIQAEQERVRAEVEAAKATQVGRYQDMIRSKIRRNIVMPPDVPETAKAEFKVTVLPGGDVMDVVLLKSSGNTAYDNAAERAIYKAQPLPLPDDAGLQKMFRELRLTIRP